MPEQWSEMEGRLKPSRSLEDRLRDHPELWVKIESLLAVVENAAGDVEKAAEAELRVTEELRQLGNEALRGWARRQAQRKEEEVAQQPERDSVPDDNAPVRAAYRYLTNRPGQFNYRDALMAKLPIGSGEVESAHRYVIQDRLKRAGAWWKLKNARHMLALRVCRANQEWDSYWQSRRQQAA
ncbi:hypothetical protein [Accumulibacter sp.]|uniref:hypothetical protein n=1 Tax=Accumulibacter sp. TaxID=2053492 RepID=UPI002600BD17|nr:hypothetical protein [Accumulibacter sp.]MCM8638068.1 hypothetical protein [Accumulibacter sp.]